MSDYYPIFVDLRGKAALVVGGGPVAEGKVRGLLEAGACVTVVSPDLTPELQQLAQKGELLWVQRKYQTGDTAGSFLVIGATNDPAANAAVWEEASARNQLANIVDDIPHCNFIAPSILRQGDLTVAISTGGRAPTLAVRLREKLEPLIGAEYARFLQMVAPLRAVLLQKHPPFAVRKKLWYQLVDSDILDLLKKGDEATAWQRIYTIFGIEPGELENPPQA
ncbi:MAG TPA: bifunctional precorrin-2 dehydrogenase/sirohydrochlorin ferrochelatase [Anaerolineales bacterium]|nr:bifunctional precorrin-2 dehydrogenase/sirohydrochlorin ferrochelatase [Anaerolineales bacterium]